MTQTILSIFAVGIGILVVAIAMNILCSYLGWSTWYDYLTMLQDKGWSQTHSLIHYWSLIFLYFIYPFVLGCTAYIGVKWLL